MNKKWLASTAAGLCATLVYIGIATLTAPVMVDGVTAATTNNTVKFILPIAVTSTTATVTWTSSHTDGNAVFTYNGTSITLTAAQRTGRSLSLTGLTPSTLYNIKLACTKSGEVEADATGTFTTLGNTTNQPPVITSATAVSCTTNTTKTYTVTTTDPNSDPITFTTGTLPAWITFARPTLTLRPVSGSSNTTVTFTASDGKGGSATLNLAITVVPAAIVNQPPVFTSATAVACTSGKSRTYIATATDANNNPVTFTYSGLPAWMTASGATLTINAVPGSTNSTVRIIASDGKGGLDTLNLSVSVFQPGVNSAPVISSPAAVACTTGKAGTYTATATDANNDSVSFAYSGLPAWASASGATLTINPTSASASSTIRIIASDGKGGFDTLDLRVSVVQPGINLPPVITCPATVICTTNHVMTYTASATDTNGDAVSYTYVGLPSWMSASGATLTLNPAPTNANSTSAVRLIASDGKGGSDTLNLSITVAKISGVLRYSASASGRFITISRTQILIPSESQKNIAVYFYQCNGALVMKRSINIESSGVAGLQDINPGVYLVRINTGSSIIANKIIIER